MNITARNFYARPSYQIILANFRALFSAKREDVLQMSKEELAIFISSDELHVNAEEDVFSIILAWINHDKNNRRSHFPELFRRVRLVYVSRDFLCSDVVTNELVKNDEDCLELAKGSIDLIDSVMSLTLDTLDRKPRKCLDSSAIVAYKTEGKYLFYFHARTVGIKKSQYFCKVTMVFSFVTIKCTVQGENHQMQVILGNFASFVIIHTLADGSFYHH